MMNYLAWFIGFKNLIKVLSNLFVCRKKKITVIYSLHFSIVGYQKPEKDKNYVAKHVDLHLPRPKLPRGG